MGRLIVAVQVELDKAVVSVPRNAQYDVKERQHRPCRARLRGAQDEPSNREDDQDESNDAETQRQSAFARGVAVGLPVGVEVYGHARGQMIPGLPVVQRRDGQH